MISTLADEDFCKKIPKVELHAHLNGSVSQKTLKKLFNNHPKKHELTFSENDIVSSGKTGYENVFNIFMMLHSLAVDIDSLKMITEDVIEEFYADNVLYLELRSTPKVLLQSSKREYIETIVHSIKKCMTLRKNLIVTYFISIDRGRSIEDAKENVDLAIEYSKLYPDLVVGIDFSGDPSKGNVLDFIPILNDIKSNGLKLTTHVGETEDEQENLALLHIKPDRVGHAVFIHPSHGGTDILLNQLTHECKKIPIEICISSNIVCGIVQSLFDHPIKDWYKFGHPFAICTDDKGLFGCDLSDEYWKAVRVLNLSRNDVWKLTKDSIEFISASGVVKKKLYELWEEYKLKLKL